MSIANHACRLPAWKTIPGVRHAVAEARRDGRTIGLVPTMGALHEGHAALIREAAARTDFVVVSIFVNPTQFGPGEDFARYPRNLEGDLAICDAAGAGGVFHPEVEEMYPHGKGHAFVEVEGVTESLEGPIRPGHFRGVATVVLKLFQIVAADVAFFGEKDYQQLVVVRRMVEELNLPIAIEAVPTVREPDGLALSSRNAYLSVEERARAAVLWRALSSARAAVAGGEASGDRIRQILRRTLESEVGLPDIDYAEVVDSESLMPLERVDGSRAARALVAVRLGKTRLIDNTPLP